MARFLKLWSKIHNSSETLSTNILYKPYCELRWSDQDLFPTLECRDRKPFRIIVNFDRVNLYRRLLLQILDFNLVFYRKFLRLLRNFNYRGKSNLNYLTPWYS